VPVIAEAEFAPETVRNDFKAYAGRWLWKHQGVRQASRYVVEGDVP
jgi:hypothetical protein